MEMKSAGMIIHVRLSIKETGAKLKKIKGKLVGNRSQASERWIYVWIDGEMNAE